MTLNLIEPLKTSTYSPKHIQITKIHFLFLFRKSIFSKFLSSKQSAFYDDLHGIISIVEGHTAQLVLLKDGATAALCPVHEP